MTGKQMPFVLVTFFACTVGFASDQTDVEQAQKETRYWKARANLLERQVKSLSALKKEVENLKQENASLHREISRLRLLLAKSTSSPASQPTSKATYFVIPVKGIIGQQFTAARMKRLLKQAAQQSPSVVVLEIDTNGGAVADAEKIVDLMISFKGLRFVALVRKSLSAGVPITIACREIYVTDSAVIGATTSWRLGNDRLPKALEEKVQSVWRATCRKAAEYGRHPSIIAEAMADPDFALTMRLEGSKIILERNGRGKVLKARGKVLTLTAREAVTCKLAKGFVEDLPTLGQRLGMTGWREISKRNNEKRTTELEVPKTGEITPSRLYGIFSNKARSLRLSNPSLTDLQRQVALKEWKEWIDKQRLIGRRVRWNITLIEASEESSQRTIARLENSIARINHTLETTKTMSKEGAKYWKARRAPLQKDLNKAKAYPIKITGTYNTPNCEIPLTAWVSKSFKKQLAKITPKSQVTLTGIIGKLDCSIIKVTTVGRRKKTVRVDPAFQDGELVFKITLYKCTLVSKGD